MPDHLLLRPDDADAAHWRWRRVDADGTDAVGSGPLAEVAPLAAGRRVLLLVPGESVLLTTAQVPVRARAKARAAIPWALEDRLVADVDELHFALGEVGEAGDWAVAVVAHADLAGWLQACGDAGLAPHAAVPEPLALPAPSLGHWSVLEEPGRVVGRTGPAGGFACAPSLLEAVAGGLEPPTAIDRVRADGAEPEWPARLAGALAPAAALEDPLQAFAVHERPSIDLLQGPYSRRERAGRLWRRWRVPAVLAACLALLLLVEWGLAYRELAAREAALRAAIEDVLRAAAPDIDRVVNPRVQLRNRLEAARGAGAGSTNGLLPMLGRAGPAIDARDEIELVALEWRGGTLDLTVETGELAALDRLQRGLQGRGLTVELRGVEQGEDRVRGQVRVTAETA